ncbi:hypothetical protein ACFCZ2_20345 [Streptomyces sp. NPDC056202]|uniref:hypothetical protein n=1 Tax=unclassified Streptomyces TaxID=2593676 RepID=UPI0035DEA0B5
MSASHPGAPVEIEWGSQRIEVADVLRELPDASAVEDRHALVKAGLDSPLAGLPEDSWHALARAVVTPATAALQLSSSHDAQSSLLLEESVDGALLRSVHSRIWLYELFPGIQPRTAQELLGTEDPLVEGVAEAGRPQAVLRYRYKSLKHLRDHIWQTISVTQSRNSYAESILARRVTRALIAHPVIYDFDDGTEPVHALVARDGITRLASAWRVLAGPESGPEDAAEMAADVLTARLATGVGGAAKPLTQRMALARELRRKELREEFHQKVGQPQDSAEFLKAVQIGQSYTLPAHVAVGVLPNGGTSLDARDVFDDALHSVLASIHVEFKAWDDAAQNVEVASRALKHVVLSRQDEGLTAVYELAVGRRTVSQTPEVYGDPAVPPTGLWRAVRLLHTLTRPAISDALRNRAKEIKGDRRMTDKGYAALLGPVVDQPWRATKKAAAAQARNAWTNGGVLFKELLKDGWSPVVTDDFTSLVETALGGDHDARMTLAVAGGTALIADKLLTRNVGSAQGTVRAPGKVPVRSDAHKVVEGLAKEGNELGLWTLAFAAQRFQDDGLPRNATQQDGLPATNGYGHYAVDLEAEDRILRHDGEPVLLLEWDVVAAAHPDKVKTPEAGGEGFGDAGEGGTAEPEEDVDGFAAEEDTAKDEDPLPPGQQIAALRKDLRVALENAKASVGGLNALAGQVSFPPLYGEKETWSGMWEATLTVFTSLQNHKPDDQAESE